MILQNISPQARVWTFLCNRFLNAAEMENISLELQNFVANWKAHGKELSATFQIIENCLVLVAVDEHYEAPSGCSIDKVFRLLTDWGTQNQCDFLQRTLLAIKIEDKYQILSQKQVAEMWESGAISAQSETLNTLVANVLDAQNKLIIPFDTSWQGLKLVNKHPVA